MDLSDLFQKLIENHRNKVIGVIIGLLFGLCVVKYGFWQSVFILICVLVGLFIGKKLDDKVDIKSTVERIFNKEQQ